MTRLVQDRPKALRAAVSACALVPALLSLLVESPVPSHTRALVTALWILSLAPAYVYFGTPADARRPIPFLPAVSLMYGLYYALPLTLGITDQYFNAPVDPGRDYDLAVDLAFFGWIALMFSYHLLGRFIGERPPVAIARWRVEQLRGLAFVFLLGGLGITLLRLRLNNSVLAGGLIQFLTSLQWFGAGALVALARRGLLGRLGKAVTAAGIIAAGALVLAGGSMAPLMLLAATILFALWIGRQTIAWPWLVGALAVTLFAMSLRGVAIEFRKAAWFGAASDFSSSDRTMLMLMLLQRRIEEEGLIRAVGNGVATTGGRSANLDLLANVARRTPSEVPHWNGETYVSLVGSFIPRFLWPDKPTKELGQAFGHRYRLIHSSNRSTSINLPFLVEFYANFSTAGVVVGMLLVGLIYRALDAAVNRPRQDPLVSLLGLVLLLPLLLIESDFSLVFGGLPLNALALYLLWLSLTTRDRRGAARTPRVAAGVQFDGHASLTMPTRIPPRN